MPFIKRVFRSKRAFFALCACILIASASGGISVLKAEMQTATPKPLAPVATLPLTTPSGVPTLASSRQTPASPTSSTIPAQTQAGNQPQTNTTRGSCTLAQHGFESGIVLPSWSQFPFGNDATWRGELPQMQAQTAACWVEMPVLLTQTGLHTTQVTSSDTQTVASFAAGVRLARSQGLHVFVALLVTVNGAGAEHWVGKVSFSNSTQEQQWFASYWQAAQPYVTAAAQAGAEQLAIGTEIQWLEDNAPASLWNTLIAQMRGVFFGTVTYDVNWTALQEPPPAWLSSAQLDLVGVSTYVPLLNTSAHVDPAAIPALWATKVKVPLDAFARSLGKPIFLSEIGYRNSRDALFNPWNITSSQAPDPQEQASACAAALNNALPDPQIMGSFFWAWDGAQALNLKDAPLATSTIKSIYQTLES